MTDSIRGAYPTRFIHRSDFENPSAQPNNTSSCCSCCSKICAYIREVFENLDSSVRMTPSSSDRSSDSSTNTSVITYLSSITQSTIVTTVTESRRTRVRSFSDPKDKKQIDLIAKTAFPQSTSLDPFPEVSISTLPLNSLGVQMQQSESLDSFFDTAEDPPQINLRRGMERIEHGSK